MTPTDKRQHWQHHTTSTLGDLSQKAYCQREALVVAYFGYWRRRLSIGTPGKHFISLGAVPGSSVARTHLSGGILVEVATGSLATVLPMIQQAVAVSGDA